MKIVIDIPENDYKVLAKAYTSGRITLFLGVDHLTRTQIKVTIQGHKSINYKLKIKTQGNQNDILLGT